MIWLNRTELNFAYNLQENFNCAQRSAKHEVPPRDLALRHAWPVMRLYRLRSLLFCGRLLAQDGRLLEHPHDALFVVVLTR